jgi:hypothetical protein
VASFVWMPLAEPSYKTRTLAGEESEPEDLEQVYPEFRSSAVARPPDGPRLGGQLGTQCVPPSQRVRSASGTESRFIVPMPGGTLRKRAHDHAPSNGSGTANLRLPYTAHIVREARRASTSTKGTAWLAALGADDHGPAREPLRLNVACTSLVQTTPDDRATCAERRTGMSTSR